ncbi:MAG: trehalose-phosphatase [Planctomycetota bacterium]|nr:trehalose-phosphatase [Planctomycetota bacterium]
MSGVPEEIVGGLARTPILLVACDFDGTLADIVDRPADARARAEALDALRRLAALPRTEVAVISGRALADLRPRLTDIGDVHVVGGHGAEWTDGPPVDGARAAHIFDALRPLERRFPGTLVEYKPAGPAVHYRHVEPARHAEFLDAARAMSVELGASRLREGLLVVEFSAVSTDKGGALTHLRRRSGASGVIFIGDDRTDEDAFATLSPPHVGVKVGEGPSIAPLRVAGVQEVAVLLNGLARARAREAALTGSVPIDAHAMLSDQRSLALIEPGGGVAWLGAPRADSPPIFSSIVAGARGGAFTVRPAGEGASGAPGADAQTYDGESFIARTRLGAITIVDYFDCTGGRAFQRAGRTDFFRHVEGAGKIRLTFAPRLDFGRTPTRLRATDNGLIVEGGADPLSLRAPGIAWSIEPDGQHHTAHAEIDLPSDGLTLELRIGSTATIPSTGGELARRQTTRQFWTGWANTLKYSGPHEALVRRSALVMKALCHGPTGAILAAGTTSLPEQLGGLRNWDYRYCWVRDGAMAAGALVRLGSTGHAMKFLDWLLGVVDQLEHPERLRPIYTVGGNELGAEGELPELPGYAESRPVRVGNGAGHQVQLDVFGPVADLIAQVAEAGAPVTPDHGRLLDAMVESVARRWNEPDNGIWEVRGPLRHHVHSRTVCWHAINRAIAARRALGEPARPREAELRDQIREDVLAHGYNARVGAFTAAYGSDDLDAACLLTGLTGLIAPDDERFVSTVRVVERGLRRNDGVMRYVYDDGLPGNEGVFHLCTGWLIEALHAIGERERARSLLDAYAAQAGPLGLYSEERDVRFGVALGNYPQAYSHLALINAACRLSRDA